MLDNPSILNILTQGLLRPGQPASSILTQGFPLEIRKATAGSTTAIPTVALGTPIRPGTGNGAGRIAPLPDTPIILDASGNTIYTRSLPLACPNKPRARARGGYPLQGAAAAGLSPGWF